jgi:hypothetical protein
MTAIKIIERILQALDGAELYYVIIIAVMAMFK